MSESWLKTDDIEPLESYGDSIPEFDLVDLENYNTVDKIPFMRYYSDKPTDDPLPMPDSHTLRYSDVPYEIERWNIFCSLPMMLKYDKELFK